MSAVSDILGFGLAGILYSKLGPRLAFVLSSWIGFLSGLIILVYGYKHQDHWVFAVLILLSKFGIACLLNTVFVAHNTLFPLLFSATAFGIINVLSRTACALSPLFAVLDEPVPMIIFTATCGVSCICSLFLQIASPDN